jgi:tetratricopeptide (TPR) repeat protein
MQQAIGFVRQAGAAFYTRHFPKAVYLLRRMLQALPRTSAYPQTLRWALLDSLEMVESWYEGLPVLESSDHSLQLLDDLHQLLAKAEPTPTEQQQLQQQFSNFDQLLEGLWVVFDFFENNNLSLQQEPLLVSIELAAKGELHLYRWQDTPSVEAIVAEFEACFASSLAHAEDYQEAVEQLLVQREFDQAEVLLLEQLERFSDNQRLVFLQLGDLYFQQERYQKAMEAYMKAVVMGTPKDQVRRQAQTACNALARHAENAKAAERWRKVLVDFF